MVCLLYEAQLEILTSISLFTSPTPNSMPKPESSTSLVFLCSLICQCGYHLIVTMCEAVLQVSLGTELRDGTELTQSHTAVWLWGCCSHAAPSFS